MVIGQMGTPALRANVNPPFIKGCRVPSYERDPSGNITTEFFSLIFRAAISIPRYARLRFERSRLIYPAVLIAHPKTGILKSPTLATQRNCIGRWASRTKISKVP
jgi:hypothetical protein